MIRAILASALLLVGCSAEPTVIDGSSPASFIATAEAARRDLPVADRLVFDRAMKQVPGSRFGDSASRRSALARTTYDGMTAAEVVALSQ